MQLWMFFLKIAQVIQEYLSVAFLYVLGIWGSICSIFSFEFELLLINIPGQKVMVPIIGHISKLSKYIVRISNT